MAVDFITDQDCKFFADNILSKEDWDGLLDLEANITDDLMPQLNSDLDLPMLDDHGLDLDFSSANFSPDLGDPWNDMGESSDSGISSVSVKHEPLSPASSQCSESSADSLAVHTGTRLECLMDSPFLSGLDIKLENPLTPPRESTDIMGPPPSKSTKLAFTLPHDSKDNIIVTLPPTGDVGSINIPTTVAGSTSLNPITLVPNTVLTTNNVKTNGMLNGVLNSKIKIQPKPIAALQPKAALPCSAPGKPLVLTAEEFAKLTSQGVLKFHPPKPDPKVQTQKVPAPLPPIAAASPLSLHENSDNKVLKRQQRMIKNRESACLSRKRKKEYMTSLEEKLQDCAKENDRLKQENEILVRKIGQLQNENERLKKSSGHGTLKRNATFLLAAVFMFGLNLGPLSGIFLASSNKVNSYTSPIHHASGRNLLAVPVPEDPYPGEHFNTNVRMLQDTVGQLRRSLEVSASLGQETKRDLMILKDLENLESICPSYFNSTESLRLADDLAGWVQRHKEDRKQSSDQLHAVHNKLQEQLEEMKLRFKGKTRKQYLPPRRLKAALRGEVDLKYPAGQSTESKYQVEVFRGPDRSYNNFLRDIQRRNDTFYVVSFKRDHLLLPATAHNKTMRPRMSLVMPALTLNDSLQPPPGSIAMMQIDCQVMDTKLVHIKETAIPSFLKENSTEHQSVVPTAGAAFP